MRHIPTSGADRKLEDETTEPEHFLVAEMHTVNSCGQEGNASVTGQQ